MRGRRFVPQRRAVAGFVASHFGESDPTITVLACGERWPTPVEGEDLRFAVEDWLGAGAILSHLGLASSPEARVCEAAFRGVQDRPEEILLNCGSGIELREKEYESDVLHAARLNLYETVPLLAEGRFVNATGSDHPEEGGRANR